MTQLAYAAWRRWRAAGKISMRGMFDGRAGWSILPCEGLGSLNAPKLQTVYPDTQRRHRRVGAAGNVPLGLFAANTFKDDLADQLEAGDPGAPWFIHFPPQLRSAEPPHLWFEQLTAETREPNGAWKRSARPNEALDLMVLCHVAAHLHAPDQAELGQAAGLGGRLVAQHDDRGACLVPPIPRSKHNSHRPRRRSGRGRSHRMRRG